MLNISKVKGMKIDMSRQCPCGRVGVVPGTIFCVNCLREGKTREDILKEIKEKIVMQKNQLKMF